MPKVCVFYKHKHLPPGPANDISEQLFFADKYGYSLLCVSTHDCWYLMNAFGTVSISAQALYSRNLCDQMNCLSHTHTN